MDGYPGVVGVGLGWLMFNYCNNTIHSTQSTQTKHGTGEQWTRCLKVPTIQLQCNMTWSHAHKTSNRRIRFCLIVRAVFHFNDATQPSPLPISSALCLPGSSSLRLKGEAGADLLGS